MAMSDYLCFHAGDSDGTITLKQNGTVSWTGSYSTDKTNWTDYTLGTVLTIPVNSNVYFKGTLSGNQTSSNYLQFVMTGGGSIGASGNVNSLHYESDFATTTTLTSEYEYYQMFYGCTSLTTPPVLPATTLTNYCYYKMFFGCTSLQSLPELPATTLTDWCYSQMFYNCQSIKLSSSQTTTYNTSYRIPSSGTGTVGVYSLYLMFSNTTGTLWIDSPSINTTYYTSNSVVANHNYLCFTAKEAGSTINLKENGSVDWVGSYSTDETNWTSYSNGTQLTLTNVGDKIYFKGKLINTQSRENYLQFVMTGRIAASGNVNSLFYESDYLTRTVLKFSYQYYSLFNGCTSLTVAPELPAKTLSSSCYYKMFYGCTNLTSTPSLPATTLYDNCYEDMFYGCTNLTQTSTLPATTLTSSCYYQMFKGCTSLTTPPVLPATTLEGSCYNNMFSGCVSLTSAPELPATTLASSCYSQMFYGCTSLMMPPKLPATTLASSCYSQMFQGCTSLVTPPVLPATTLTNYCYLQMFRSCTNLTQVPELPATTLASNCYSGMFYGCTNLVQLPSLPARVLTTSCYNGMFRNCTGIKLSTTKTEEYNISYRIPTSVSGTIGDYSLDNMFAGTGGTFTGTPSINTTYYYSNKRDPVPNIVSYGNTILLDLSNDTVTSDKVRAGITFHGADGQFTIGTATGGSSTALSGTKGINKVIYNGKTLIDLTADTITPGDVAYGYTFHACDGNQYTGTYQ